MSSFAVRAAARDHCCQPSRTRFVSQQLTCHRSSTAKHRDIRRRDRADWRHCIQKTHRRWANEHRKTASTKRGVNNGTFASPCGGLYLRTNLRQCRFNQWKFRTSRSLCRVSCRGCEAASRPGPCCRQTSMFAVALLTQGRHVQRVVSRPALHRL
jgi:hypothetical protein